MTTRATPERLGALLEDGLAPEVLDRTETRLDAALSRPNATGALAESFQAPVETAGAAQSLGALFISALERNPDIGRAAQAINRADAARMNAIYGYLPQVSISYTYTDISQEVVSTDNEVFERGTAQYPVTNIGAQIHQPVFDLSRIYNIQLQNAARSVAEVEYIAAVQAATYETFDTYLRAVQSKARISEIQNRMQMINRQIAAEGALVSLGLSTEITSRAVAAELATLASDEALESAQFSEALSKLSYLTGSVISDVAEPSTIAGIGDDLDTMTAETAFALAEEQNPTLLISALDVVQTELGRRQALAADFAPVLEAFATYEDETREGSRFGGGSQTVDTNVGVRLTIPIFNAQGQGYLSTLETVDLRAAALDYYASRRQLQTEIESTLRRLEELSTAIGQSARALSQVSANVSAEEARRDSGEGIELAVISTQLFESSARERLEYQRLEYVRAWGRLRFLTGADLSRLGL